MLRVAIQFVLVTALALALAELAARFVLDMHPISVDYEMWQSHETLGWAHRPGSRSTYVRLGFQQEIEINSRGLREREIAYERTPGRRRIVVLGDSGVVSFEVPPAKVFTRVLERSLQRRGYDVEVINAGTRGYGTDQSLLFLRDEAMKYHPDLVLYRWSPTDPADNVTAHLPFRRFGKAWFHLDEHGALQLRGTPVEPYPYEADLRVGEDGRAFPVPVSLDRRLRVFLRDNGAGRSALVARLLHHASQAQLIPGAIQSLASVASPTRKRSIDRTTRRFRITRALVGEMRDVAAAGGARFALFGPSGDGWAAALIEELELANLRDWKTYRSRVPPGVRSTMRFDPHMNALGHELFGETIAEAILEHALLEP